MVVVWLYILSLCIEVIKFWLSAYPSCVEVIVVEFGFVPLSLFCRGDCCFTFVPCLLCRGGCVGEEELCTRNFVIINLSVEIPFVGDPV